MHLPSSRRSICALVAALLLATPLAAMATLIDVTMDGTVSAGTDITGVFFGTTFTNLAGDPFKLDFKLDDGKGTEVEGGNSASLVSAPNSNPSAAAAANPITATLTLYDSSSGTPSQTVSFGTLPAIISSTAVIQLGDTPSSTALTFQEQSTSTNADGSVNYLGDNSIITVELSSPSSFISSANFLTPYSYTLTAGSDSSLANFGVIQPSGDPTSPQLAYGSLNISSISSSGPDCASVLNNAVAMPELSGRTLWNNFGLSTPIISSSFTPNFGLSLADAAAACSVNGYSIAGFNWQQVARVPAPSPFYVKTPSGSIVNVIGDGPDPQPGDQYYVLDSSGTPIPRPGVIDDTFPFFCGELDFASGANCAKTADSINYFDFPEDDCLPYSALDEIHRALIGYDIANNGCLGAVAEAGSVLSFNTRLVAVSTSGDLVPLSELGVAPSMDTFSWTDSFNGSSGGISYMRNDLLPDEYSGSGGITLTSFDGTLLVSEPSGSCLLCLGSIFLLIFSSRRQFPLAGRRTRHL